MDLRQLRYFLAVADAGQLTRAAARLGLQQPPLSQQIHALERQLGMPLFQRHAKGVTLTDGGRLLADEARRLLADVAAMEDRIGRVARGRRGVLQVAFTSSAAAHAFTPEALRACRSRHPEIDLLIGESNAAEITDAVAAGRLHCGLLRVPVARAAGLVLDTLLREPVVAALPLDHALARRRRIALRDLHAQELILVRRPGAPGLYANLLALCEQRQVEPKVVAEVERMMTALNLVAAGTGMSIVPASMQGVHAHAIAYRTAASDVRVDAPLTLVYRRDRCVGALQVFVALLHEIAAAPRDA
jgi:DNA-binding transcriptional LysR family regulator